MAYSVLLTRSEFIQKYIRYNLTHLIAVVYMLIQLSHEVRTRSTVEEGL